ncbi:MAG: hypothetical protein ACYC0Q_05985 [Eubacteriales bacterium]
MASKIGTLSIGLDLSNQDFLKGIQESSRKLNEAGQAFSRQTAIIKAEFGTAIAKLGETATAADSLRVKSDYLTTRLDEQKKYVSLLSDAYSKGVAAKGTDSEAVQKLAVRLAKAQEEEAKLERSLRSTTAQIERQGAIALKEAEGRLAPAFAKIGTLLKGLGIAAVGGFAAVGGAGMKANADMELYRNTLNTVMGDSEKAGQTLAWVKEYAAKTPFEMPGLVESTVKLQAMGLQAQKFLPIAGDMAAVFRSSGKTVGDAAEAINDAMMGEFERLKEFGIKLQASDFSAGGKYAGRSYAEGLEAEFKTHNYTGSAKALSNTFVGQLSNLKDSVGNILQGATAPLFERLTAGLGGVMAKITELQENGTLQAWTVSLAAGMNNAWNVLEKVGGVIFNIAKGIIDNWGLIGPIIGGVVGAFATFKTIGFVKDTIDNIKGSWAALNIIMKANPIVAAIGLAIMAGVALYQNWDTIAAKAQELWAKITGVWDAIKTKTSEVWEGIKTTLTNLWNNLLNFWGSTSPVGYVVMHWEEIQARTVEIWTVIQAWLSGLWQQILTTAQTVWGNIKLFIVGVVGEISNNFDNLVKSAFNWGKNLLQNFIDGIKAMWGNLRDTVSDIANTVTGFLGSGSSVGGEAAIGFPAMAAGGIVTRPTLALVGESGPEAVVPLNKTLLSLSGGASTTTTNNFNISITGMNAEEIWDNLQRKLVRAGVRFNG